MDAGMFFIPTYAFVRKKDMAAHGTYRTKDAILSLTNCKRRA